MSFHRCSLPPWVPPTVLPKILSYRIRCPFVHPYRSTPPKLEVFRGIVNKLLQHGVVRTSKSPYDSPAFLVPKSGGGFRRVVDYRKVNSKIVLDSYPMPTIEQAFEQFGGVVVFSVLDLNPRISVLLDTHNHTLKNQIYTQTHIRKHKHTQNHTLKNTHIHLPKH
jgi:hypothetical protein